MARGLARRLGWKAALVVSGQHDETGENSAKWVLITANTGVLAQPGVADRVSPWSDGDRPPITWTDDFASLWQVLKF